MKYSMIAQNPVPSRTAMKLAPITTPLRERRPLERLECCGLKFLGLNIFVLNAAWKDSPLKKCLSFGNRQHGESRQLPSHLTRAILIGKEAKRAETPRKRSDEMTSDIFPEPLPRS